MEITVEKKFCGDKIDNNVKLRNIIDQVTLLLYGKKLNQCLGHTMPILKKSLPECAITVKVPKTVWDNADHVDYRCTGYGWRMKTSTVQDYLQNVIRHGVTEGVKIHLLVE